MESQIWLNVRIECGFELVNRASDVLEDLGALAVSIRTVRNKGDHEVTGLFQSTSADAEQISTAILSEFNTQRTDTVTVSHDFMQDRNWVLESQQRFRPLEISKRLWITAPWHSIDVGSARQVVINPGMSFGTGHHATTQMCLEFLSDVNLTGRVVMDYGCGSGILAISALVLGAQRAYGIDIDPEAVAESVENARRNQVDDRYVAWVSAQVPAAVNAGVVVANLSRNALIDVREILLKLTSDEGLLALAGLVDFQAEEIREFYSGHFDFESKTAGEWVMLFGQKRI